jgi:hypothetical protein
MHTGTIIDFYDDPNGSILKQKLPFESVPLFIKEAQFLNEDKRDQLPNDVFALVAVDQGKEIRKFACTDKGNTAINVIYFLETNHKLPEEAQKTAAANLICACHWYDIAPPSQLKKLASLESLAVSAIKNPTKILNAGMHGTYMKDQIEKGVNRHRAMIPKLSDLSATEIMPNQSNKLESGEKIAEVFQSYVDITGKTAPLRVEKLASKRFCLGQQFPVDSYDEVKLASQWFFENGDTLHPEDRKTYCTNLVSRAEELIVDLNPKIHKYASNTYASNDELEAAVCTRMQFWTEDSPERDLLKSLMEKRAEISPEIFCEALQQIDEVTGLHYHWDSAVCDPWYSTYGVIKEAGTDWTFEYCGDRVDEDMLKCLSHKGYNKLKSKFGCELTDEFMKKPRETFESLPLDSKRIIMHMANDPQP